MVAETRGVPGAPQGGNGGGVPFEGEHAGSGGQRVGEAAATGEQLHDRALDTLGQQLQHGVDDGLLALARGLEKGAGRHRRRVAGEGEDGALQERGGLVLHPPDPAGADARHTLRLREGGQRSAVAGGNRRVGAEQEIGTVVEQVDAGLAVALEALEPEQDRAQRLHQGEQPRVQDRAGLHVDDLSGAAAVQADLDRGADAADCEIHAAPRRRRRAGEGERRQAEGGGSAGGLPGGVGFVPPVLQGAAAARAEMRAGRNYAVGRGVQDVGISRKAVAALGQRTRLHPLAGQGAGEEQSLGVVGRGDAVTVRTDPLDPDGSADISRRRRRDPSVPGQGSAHARRACLHRC